MRKISLVILLLVCTAVICGCTTPLSSSSSPQASPASQPVVTQPAAPVSNGIVKNIDIIQRSFDPAIVTVSAGTTVVWTNKDTVNHRVVHLTEYAGDKEMFHSESLSKGQSFSYTFATPGRYKYGDPQYGGGVSTYLVIVE